MTPKGFLTIWGSGMIGIWIIIIILAIRGSGMISSDFICGFVKLNYIWLIWFYMKCSLQYSWLFEGQVWWEFLIVILTIWGSGCFWIWLLKDSWLFEGQVWWESMVNNLMLLTCFIWLSSVVFDRLMLLKMGLVK